MSTAALCNPDHDVALIGMACKFPDADTVEAFWQNLLAAKESFRPIPRERWDHELFHSEVARELDKTYVTRGAFVDGVAEFAALHFGIAPRRVAVMDPQHRLLLDCVRRALIDAGLEDGAYDRSMVGTFLGVSSSEYRQILATRTMAVQMVAGAFGDAPADEQAAAALKNSVKRLEPVSAFSIPGALLNMTAANVANQWMLGGPAFTIDAACASAMVSVYDAVLYLRSGACNLAIAGGAYLNLTPENLIGFARASAISRAGRCRPFDQEADGFLQGEGVGVVILKRLADARRDGDRVYAVIRGIGINNDGSGEGPMAPSLPGQTDCLRRAFKDAGFAPETVGLVECHGTATKVGDPVEVGALRELFGSTQRAQPVWLSSVKANIGHLMSAAGVAGLMRATLALFHRTIPPQAAFSKASPELKLDEGPFAVPRQATPWLADGQPRRAGVSSFGFGGTNCHLLLEEAPAEAPRPIQITSPPRSELVVLGAESRALLARGATELATAVAQSNGSLADIAYTLTATRKHDRVRLALVVESRDELCEALRDAAQRLAGEGKLPLALGPRAWLTPADLGEQPPAVAFMFPGQGAQRVGLLRHVYDRFPSFRARLDELAAAVQEQLDRPLTAYLYPQADSSDLSAAEKRLQATEVCQPVMVALGIATADLLSSLGVRPAVCLGHSLGEFAAAAAAGKLSGEEAVRFVAERGKLMAAIEGDPGAMAAVRTGSDVVRRYLRPGVCIANINEPSQTVISGETTAVEAVSEALARDGVGVRRLRVSHAFHSERVAGAAAGIAKLVEGLTLQPGGVPLVSATTGDLYPDAAERQDEVRAVFNRHATSSVDFVAAVKRARAAGAEIFVQVGAGKALCTFATSTLGGDLLAVAQLAAEEEDGGRELLRCLGTLAVLGHTPDFRKLYAGEERRVVSLPAAPLAVESYWALRDKGVPIEVATATTNRGEGVVQSKASEELVKLFREQTALLARQAEIIAQQTAALQGEPAKTVAASSPAAPIVAKASSTASLAMAKGPDARGSAPQVSAASAREQPAAGAARASAPAAAAPSDSGAPLSKEAILDKLYEAVSKVSAFPRASLKPSQSLAGDLGLDSLMFVELSSAVQAAFPGLGGIPQSLMSQRTTIADVAAHVHSALAKSAPSARAATPVAPTELSWYRPALGERALSHLHHEAAWGDGWTLVTTAGGALSGQIVERLVESGLRLIVAELGLAASKLVGQGSMRRIQWPAEPEEIDRLFDALATAGTKPHAVIHLAPLGCSSPLAATLEQGSKPWPDPVPVAQRLAAGLFAATQGKPCGFVAVTAMGGDLGIEGVRPDALWQSALAGFAKSLQREWTDSIVKCIDLDPSEAAAADHVATELTTADRAVEVAYRGKRFVVRLRREKSAAGEQNIDGRSVVLVSGGGRGLGAKVAIDLARRTHCRLLIVGTSPAGGPQLEANLRAMREAGSEVEYLQWDIRQPAPVALDAARKRLGGFTGILHCAGVIRDKRVADKPIAAVREVMDVKVGGLLSLLRATASDPINLVVGFSSWAGRFGNVGQTDYAAANELMGRLIAQLDRERRGVKALAVAWPPWESSDMARSIPEPVRAAMRAEGIPFLSDEVGVAAFWQALQAGGGGELLVGPELPAELCEIEGALRLDVTTHPYLDDHRINGVPLLPMAAALDYLGTAARQALGPGSPLWLHDVELFKGVEVRSPTAVRLLAQAKSYEGRPPEAAITLEANGAVAYRAEASVGSSAPLYDVRAPGGKALSGADLPLTLEAFYRDVTFHGPRLRGIERLEELGERHVTGLLKTSRPADWLASPEQDAWCIDPLTVDASFQLVLYHLWARERRAALPVGCGAFVQHAPFGAGPVRCTVVLQEATADSATGSIRYEDERGHLLAVMHEARAKLLDTRPVEHANPPAEAARTAPSVGAVDERYWKVESFEEVAALRQRLDAAAIVGLRNPYFWVNDGIARNTSIVNGREMVNYSSYNYLGLSGHPRVSAAAKAAVDRYGTSVSASRIASGEKPLHGELERAIADFLGCEDSVVFSAGHATNESVIGNLFREGDLIIHDSLAHNSIQQGATLSGAKRRPFPHNDWRALDELLKELRPHYNKVLIAIEGVYSMDGDIPDLPRFIEVKERHRALLFVDEAHSLGVLGETGRGIGELFNVDRKRVEMWMGTLSKSLASCGGYIAGGKALVEYIRYSAPGFVFSAGITPANAAAAKAAIEELSSHPELVATLRARSRFFLRLCREHGVDTGLSDGSAVVPCIVGNSLISLRLSDRLAEAGINVQPIVYPAVDDDASRLRFFLGTTHTEEQLRRTVATVAAELGNLRRELAAETVPAL